MPTTQENPTTSPIGRDTPRVDGPLQGDRHGAVHLRLPLSRDALCRAGRGDDRQRHESSSSTRPRPRRCPACARSFIARTSARSSARSWGRASKASATSAARRSKTTSFATTASTSRWPWRTRSRRPRPPPMRCASTYAKEKPNVETDLKADDEPDVVCHDVRPARALQSERGDADGAFASAPVKLDQTYVTPAETHNPHRAARDDRDLGRRRR